MCIIPPFCKHKTEGDAYCRINVNASPKALTASEAAYLHELGKQVVFSLNLQKADLFLKLLNSAALSRLKTPHDELTEPFCTCFCIF